jgi:hypothetical protein
MSFWNRTLAVLGLRKSAVAFEGDRVVLRDLQQAKAFPQEPAESGPKELTACKHCGVPRCADASSEVVEKQRYRAQAEALLRRGCSPTKA